MSLDNARVEKILREYLERYLEGNKLDGAWTVASFPITGRGLCTNRDLQPGDIIFWDHPIVIGPRVTGKPVCVGCHLESDDLQQCPKGCSLPVCQPQCSNARVHQNECTILASYGHCNPDDSWSIDSLRSLTALRCLQINDLDKEVVQCLQGNKSSTQEFEVEILKKKMGENFSQNDEEWIRLCCRVLNTNAFETMKRVTVKGNQREGTLRGLYPLAALMNHHCSPNTRHVFDDNYNMITQATVFIPAGKEITTSYCPQLWDTSSRRLHLARTKQFACCCERCKDPTEFGTFLSGLSCPESPCTGVILSTNPLAPHKSSWLCTECLANIPIDQVLKLQRVQGLLLMGTDSSNPQSIMDFLELKRVPSNSVVEIQLKLGLCFQLGHVESFKWEDLTDDQLKFKEKLCREIIEILEKLRLGECRLRGVILFELYCMLSEQMRRLITEENGKSEENTTKKSIKEVMDKTFKATSDILAIDATAPKEFHEKLLEMHSPKKIQE